METIINNDQPVVDTTTEQQVEQPAEKTKIEQQEQLTTEKITELITKTFADLQVQKTQEETEAQKLAKMSETEKQVYKLQQELEKTQKELQLKTEQELRSTAAKTFAENGLSGDLAKFINITDAEAAMKDITTLTAIVKDAIAKEVNAKLGTTTTTINTAGTTPNSNEAEVRKLFGL